MAGKWTHEGAASRAGAPRRPRDRKGTLSANRPTHSHTSLRTANKYTRTLKRGLPCVLRPHSPAGRCSQRRQAGAVPESGSSGRAAPSGAETARPCPWRGGGPACASPWDWTTPSDGREATAPGPELSKSSCLRATAGHRAVGSFGLWWRGTLTGGLWFTRSFPRKHSGAKLRRVPPRGSCVLLGLSPSPPRKAKTGGPSAVDQAVEWARRGPSGIAAHPCAASGFHVGTRVSGSLWKR